jgi:hypothetical protein
MKLDRTGGIAREHAVEHQRVDVDVQIERAAKALNDGHGAPTWLLETDGAPVVPQQAEYGAQEDGGHPAARLRQGFGEARRSASTSALRAAAERRAKAAQVVVPREPVPQSGRQTQDPLSNRYVREDVIDQMHGTFGPASAKAPARLAAALRAKAACGDHRNWDRAPAPCMRRGPAGPGRSRRSETAANPPARNPHRRKSRNACSTNGGRPSPSRKRAAWARKVSKGSCTIR